MDVYCPFGHYDGTRVGDDDPPVSDRAEDGTLQYSGSVDHSHACERIWSISVQAVY